MIFSTSSSNKGRLFLLAPVLFVLAACSGLTQSPAGLPAGGGAVAERVVPAVTRDDLLAVLPVENLSGVRAPLRQIGAAFSQALADDGIRLLPEPALQQILRKHRVRYTGGLDSRSGRALQAEAGTHAAFVLSLESYQEGGPPKISLFARLVLSQERPEILWMESVGLSGDASPGLLGLGVQADAEALIAKAVQTLVASFADYLDRTGRPSSGSAGHSRPQRYYRSPAFDASGPLRVAVLPFSNPHAPKNAGYVVPLHLMQHLLPYANVEVIEPGLIREALLQFRIVMEAGPSLAVADALASERVLGADLIVAGTVFDYQGLKGVPKVNFSVQAVETQSREVVWWSKSHAAGDDGVLFFDFGKSYSAHRLTTRMATSIAALLMAGDRD